MTDKIGRILAVQEHQKEAIFSLEKYKWHHIGLTVSGIIFSAVVLIGIGGMYFSLDNKLETRIAAVEQQMAAGFAELKAEISKLQNNAE